MDHSIAVSFTMNKTFNLGLVAASIVLLSQPLYAKDDKKGGGGGKKDGGGKHPSAPAAHAGRTPNSAATKAPAPHFAAQSQRQFKNKKSAPVAQLRPQTFSPPAVSRTRAFAQPHQRTAPTVAFGGATYSNSNAPVNAQNSRTFARNRNGASNSQPSVDVSRGWDRGSSHTWNHHHYRWNDGNWVVIDNGGYGYPYGYDNGYNAGPRMMYDSQSLAESVQVQLARQGYNPGPTDGVIGGQTRQAIADFQNDHRLPVTGEIDGPLLQAMGLN